MFTSRLYGHYPSTRASVSHRAVRVCSMKWLMYPCTQYKGVMKPRVTAPCSLGLCHWWGPNSATIWFINCASYSRGPGFKYQFVDRNSSSFPLRQANIWNYDINTSFQIMYNQLFSSISDIRQDIIWATDRIIK